MKQFLLIIFLLLSTFVNSQTVRKFTRALKEKYPQKESFTADGIWIYYPHSVPEELDFPVLKRLKPSWTFYKVSLTNHLDSHILESECVVFFDASSKELILNEPIWFGGLCRDFYKKFIGIKVKKNELQQFADEFEQILLFGSDEFVDSKIVNASEITYNLVRVKSNGIYRIIQISFDSQSIIEIKDQAAPTLEVIDVIK